MIDDIAVIGVLVLLEGVLSIDNALVLAVLARSVKPELQKKVLTYGLIGAVVLRMTAIFLAQSLLQFSIIKIAGAAYLLYLCIHFFVTQGVEKGEKGEVKARGLLDHNLTGRTRRLGFCGRLHFGCRSDDG
jgi:predicted tellurium resistance membrane protein TerC